MDNKENNYIQLPALPRNMTKEAVGFLWEFIKLSPESQLLIKNEIELADGWKKMNEEELLEFEKSISGLPEEDISEIHQSLQQLISQIMYEACDMVAWVYERKYKRGLSLHEMVDEYPSAEEYIMIICAILESQADFKSGIPTLS